MQYATRGTETEGSVSVTADDELLCFRATFCMAVSSENALVFIWQIVYR
jgi:hypothetical protein